MKVYDCKLGRLGNAIFRYFASSLFCILYDAQRTYNQNECNVMMSDQEFINWSKQVLEMNIPQMNTNSSFMFYGYFQHDKIYWKFKKQIINWILTHPNELLYTDGNDGNITYFNYNQTSYKAIDLLRNPYADKEYQVVVHLRLEDFVGNNDVIHPESIKKVLDKINKKNICFVVNKPKTELEEKYIEYFRKYYNITLECNSVIEDYHIMRNAKTLVCSCSTLSWIAPFLSEKVELVYFPNYNNNRIHETFKKPIENTILYEFTKCKADELANFLNNKVSKVDPYCSLNCRKQPITSLIIDYVKDIESGFYLELGAHDGIFQSNTKFLEEEYGWTGLLIEAKTEHFKQLKKNRPNNILINKKIDENETLLNLLDYLDIPKIDLMIIDTDGTEFEVLDTLNLEKHRPTYLLIQIMENQKHQIFTYLEGFNYILLENVTNYNILDNPGWDGTHNDYLFKAM
jgi:hypothetical protein